MATDIFTETAPDAEEHSLRATWIEIAFTLTVTAIALFIVGSIAIVMSMA